MLGDIPVGFDHDILHDIADHVLGIADQQHVIGQAVLHLHGSAQQAALVPAA